MKGESKDAGSSAPSKGGEESPKNHEGARVHRAHFGSVIAVNQPADGAVGGDGGSLADIADKANAKANGVAKSVAIFKTYAEENLLRRKSSVEGMASMAAARKKSSVDIGVDIPVLRRRNSIEQVMDEVDQKKLAM